MGMQYTAFSDISNYHVAAHISHYISALYPPSMAIVSLFFHPMNIAGYPTAFPWDQFFSWFIRYELLKNVGCISHGIPMEYLNIPPYIPIFVAWTTILHGQLYSYDIFSFIHPVWDVLGAVIPERRRMPFLFLRRNTKPFQSVTWSWNVYLGDPWGCWSFWVLTILSLNDHWPSLNWESGNAIKKNTILSIWVCLKIRSSKIQWVVIIFPFKKTILGYTAFSDHGQS